MKIRKEKWTLWIMLAVMLLTACSSDDTPSSSYVGDETREICFNADVSQVKSGTRATTIDDDGDLQAQDIRIDAYAHGTTTSAFSGAKLHYYDSSWKFWESESQTHYYWPIEGSVINSTTVTSLDFVGYCPYVCGYVSDLGYTSSAVTFSCNMSSFMTHTAQSDITEFMCALLQDQTYATQEAAPSRALPLAFKHPFTRIKFQLSASHPDITINSITLGGLKSSGTCSFDGSTSTWSDRTGDADFVATVNQTLNTNASAQQIGSDYILIPQEFSGNIVVNATWKVWGEDAAHSVSTTISPVTWQPGHSYTYTFTITETDLVVNTTEKYTEQW